MAAAWHHGSSRAAAVLIFSRQLLDILTDFTLGRTMRSILAGQCEDLGTLHIKPASSPKRKLYIRWAESSAREV